MVWLCRQRLGRGFQLAFVRIRSCVSKVHFEESTKLVTLRSEMHLEGSLHQDPVDSVLPIGAVPRAISMLRTYFSVALHEVGGEREAERERDWALGERHNFVNGL